MEKSIQKLLIIGSVWPEPNSSAAGWRMMELIDFFKTENYEITFASSAADSLYSFPIEENGISKVSIELNNDNFNDFITELNPSIVLFDRFMTEEQFGWRVIEHCPNALRILDTEDLHCLRLARQNCFKEKTEFQLSDLNSDTAKREIASIYRCDLTLIISEYEMELLINHFMVDSSLLLYLPFMLPKLSASETLQWKTFEERKHIVFIGNFYHEPNWNSVLFLKEEIWPLLSKKLPQTELHIYGAYPSQKITNLQNPKDRFFCFGRAESAKEVISNAKLLLAPIRFGAGLKGKLAEAMMYGTPSVTTSMGAEGMNGDFKWNGEIQNEVELIVNSVINFITNKEKWLEAQKNGIDIINNRFDKEYFRNVLKNEILKLKVNLESHREANFTGQLLIHHSLSSTKYLSKWIMEKNRSRS